MRERLVIGCVILLAALCEILDAATRVIHRSFLWLVKWLAGK